MAATGTEGEGGMRYTVYFLVRAEHVHCRLFVGGAFSGGFILRRGEEFRCFVEQFKGDFIPDDATMGIVEATREGRP